MRSSLGSALCVVVVGGLTFLAGERYASRGNAEMVRVADSLSLVYAGEVARSAQLAAQDSVRQDSLAAIRHSLVVLTARKEQSMIHTDTLLVAVADEDLRDSLTQAVLVERAASDSMVSTYQREVSILTVQLDTTRAERDRYQRLCEQYNVALQQAVHQPRSRSVLRDAALLAGGVLGGFVLSH